MSPRDPLSRDPMAPRPAAGRGPLSANSWALVWFIVILLFLALVFWWGWAGWGGY